MGSFDLCREAPVAVVGPGSMGLLWASHLAQSVTVQLIGRMGSPAVRVTIGLTHADGTQQSVALHRYSPDKLPSPPGLVLITTKAQDLEAAFGDLSPHIPPTTPIVFFQNGVGVQRQLAMQNPGRPLLAASTTEGAFRPDPDHLVHAGRGETWVGGLTDSGQQVSEAVTASLLNTGMQVTPVADIETRLWRKLAVNVAINPFTAILGCRNGQLNGRPFFEQRLPAVLEEFIAVAMAHEKIFGADQLSRMVRQVLHQTGPNRSSMLQDLIAGKMTEIEHLNGFLVKEGKRLGIEMPVNRELTNAVLSLTTH